MPKETLRLFPTPTRQDTAKEEKSITYGPLPKLGQRDLTKSFPCGLLSTGEVYTPGAGAPGHEKKRGRHERTLGMVPPVLLPKRPLARARSTSAAAARETRISSSCSAICTFVSGGTSVAQCWRCLSRDGIAGGDDVVGTLVTGDSLSACWCW